MVGGYAAAMSDESTSETKPGPANPQPEGEEAATPPGGSLRQDGPAPQAPGGHDDDVSGGRAANKHASESGGHTIDIEDEQPSSNGSEDDGEDLQEENAETSLDQPSEG